jgi:hypothetical protein
MLACWLLNGASYMKRELKLLKKAPSLGCRIEEITGTNRWAKYSIARNLRENP